VHSRDRACVRRATAHSGGFGLRRKRV